MTGPYDDIINLPHHVSVSHPHMPNIERAAQFSPFAALTGFEGAIEETARLTDDLRDISDSEREKLDAALAGLMRNPDPKADVKITRNPDPKADVKITYFVPDARKEGGEYVTEKVRIRRVDTDRREIVTMDKRRIAIDMILALGEE